MSSLYLGSSSPTSSCTSHRILLPFYGSCKYAWKVKLIICEKKNVQFCRRILSQMWDLGSKTAKALSVNLVISWEASILDINAVALQYCIAISCHISLYLAIYCHIVYLAVLPYCISCILNADPNQGGHDFDAAKVIVYRMYRCVYNVYVQCIVYNVYYACVLYLFMHMYLHHVYVSCL